MADWSTAASLATAVGTLVLALATFVAVRAANRAARVAEYSMQIGIRPLLMPSRLEDPVQKIMWGDEFHRGAGRRDRCRSGIGWRRPPRDVAPQLGIGHRGDPRMAPGAYRSARPPRPRRARQLPPPDPRSLCPGGDIGFWQGSLRDPEDPDYAVLLEAVTTRRLFEVELLYSDHEGGQRAIGRFGLAPIDDGRWLCSIVRHWNLDRPDPRPSE